MQDTRSEAQIPLVDVVCHHPKNVISAMGMPTAENGNFYVITVFVLTYVTQLRLLESTVLLGVIIGAAVGLLTIPSFGALSDRVGRRPVYLFGAAFSLIFSFPFFWLMGSAMPGLIWLAIVLGHDPMYGSSGEGVAPRPRRWHLVGVANRRATGRGDRGSFTGRS